MMIVPHLTAPYALAAGACLFLYFIVYPIVVYFKDVKGKSKSGQLWSGRLRFKDCVGIPTCLSSQASPTSRS